jgi:hypothetical protein
MPPGGRAPAPLQHRPIISEPARRSSPGERRLVALAGGGALLAGLVATIVYDLDGLTLSHYDARAHLVVARRIADSLTPGWRQIGAVWLPLPHLLNALPVQLDVLYRSGASAVVLSMLGHGLAVASVAWLVLRASGSPAGALAAAAVLGLNPNALYLQSTPMTEPLLLGLLLFGVARLYVWTVTGGTGPTAAPGVVLAAACLTRYEAWPVTAAALALSAFALWRENHGPRLALSRTAVVAVWPVGAVLGFLGLSRATIGVWFVTGGFYVPDNPALGNPLRAADQVIWGLWSHAGSGLLAAAAAGAAVILVRAASTPARARLLIALAPFAAGALPWYAFVQGHPFRIRYMVPLVAASALAAGIGLASLPRGRAVAATMLVAVAAWQAPPLDRSAPMVREARWDVLDTIRRGEVTRYLAMHYGGETILASMGSLAHYMQQTAAAGFRLRDFLHEGNGQLWQEALRSPVRHVGWIAIEERAQGGDMLFRRGREDPEFLEGFERVVAGGGLALYRRAPAQSSAVRGESHRRPAPVTPARGARSSSSPSAAPSPRRGRCAR